MRHGARKKEAGANERTPGTKQNTPARTGNGSNDARENEEKEGATVSVCSKLLRTYKAYRSEYVGRRYHHY